MSINDDKLRDHIHWVQLTETTGPLPAEVIAGRLKSEGIPAWVWQQGAGGALGLTFGPMGRGHVMVPQESLDRAQLIIEAEDESMMIDEGEFAELNSNFADVDEEKGWLSKGILALTALAVSPIGVAAALILAKLSGGEGDFSAECSDCKIIIDLDEQEETQGWFICPDCGRKTFLQ